MSQDSLPSGDRMNRRDVLVGAATAIAAVSIAESASARTTATPILASWKDGPAKQGLINFARATGDASSPNFVKPEDRIATFDQDGTLWVEHPLYAQAAFAVARVVALAPEHPDWKTTPPFSAVLSGNPDALATLKEEDWAQIIAATHSGMDTEAFLEIASQWLATAKHPRFGRLYTELTYQPMREALDFLRAAGFKTYIVTGGGQEFVRAFAQRVYGIPVEQVIGSGIQTKYEFVDSKPVLMREPKLFFNDNNDGKAIGINLFVGKRPYAAFGNSTGDQQMLEWTGAGAGARLKMLVLHDDPVREYAYGPAGGLPDTSVGTFSPALLSEARTRGWTVISMKNDWSRIFSFE
jgi:phosphoglycolate phosphatase-like HAD superfamily hydrolase